MHKQSWKLPYNLNVGKNARGKNDTGKIVSAKVVKYNR